MYVEFQEFWVFIRFSQTFGFCYQIWPNVFWLIRFSQTEDTSEYGSSDLAKLLFRTSNLAKLILCTSDLAKLILCTSDLAIHFLVTQI